MTKRKKTSKWPYILIGIIIVSLIGLVIYKKNKRPKGIEVEIDKVKLRSIIEKVGASGRIFPEKEVKISSDVSGEVVELFVAEGDSVSMGQLLAKIDPEAYVSAVERGEAGLNTARSQWAMSKSQIDNNIAQIEQIKAQVDNAQRIYERNRKLLDEGVISASDFESSESTYHQLQANLRAAEAGMKSAQESANASEYTVKSSNASLKELKTNLKKTSIFAPTQGIISSLSIEKGERVVGTIQMAGTEMMRIANLASMEAQVEVSENDILRVNLGDYAEVEVDAYLNRTFTGRITEIARSAANVSSDGALTSDQVTNFIVKIRLDPESYKDLLIKTKDYPFRPGMSASVDIFTNQVDSTISVPIQAVTVRDIDEDEEKEDLKEVVFVMKNDSALMKLVETGIQDDEFIEISSGLEADETIIKGPYAVVSRELEDKKIVVEKEKKKDKKGN